MKLQLSGKNLYIVNKKPQAAVEIEISSATVFLKNEKSEILAYGEIHLEKDIYACLFCRQLRNITFVVKREGNSNEKGIFSGALIIADEAQFEAVLKFLQGACPALILSEQNAKINGYAGSVVEKLQEGTTVTIMETKEEKVKCCPVCGMECDPNIPYCMECGAPV